MNKTITSTNDRFKDILFKCKTFTTGLVITWWSVKGLNSVIDMHSLQYTA